MRYLKGSILLLAICFLSGCDDTDFETTWRSPNATTVDLGKEAVSGFLLSRNASVRRSFEYQLAEQLNEKGIEATPGYKLLPEADVTDKKVILNNLKNTGIDAAVFMRIVDRKLEVTYVPGTAWYPGSAYDPFLNWGDRVWVPGAYGAAWPAYYDLGYYRTDTVVSVETLVYSVPKGELLWAGYSRTMNPSEVDDFVEELTDKFVDKIEDNGLIRKEDR